MAKQKTRVPLAPSTAAPFHNPFAKLQATSELPPGPPPSTPATPTPEPLGAALARLPHIHLRRERKGRAGKTVTQVTGVEPLTAQHLEELCVLLRKTLGCGAHLERGSDTCLIVLQGDQIQRTAILLEAHGVRRVKA